MGTKIDHDKLYKIQTYSFHDAIITVTESCYGRTEIDPPTKPNKHGYMHNPLQYTLMALSITTSIIIGKKLLL